MNRLQRKVALVTSALGLGRATASLLAREGVRVVTTDIRSANPLVAKLCKSNARMCASSGLRR